MRVNLYTGGAAGVVISTSLGAGATLADFLEYAFFDTEWMKNKYTKGERRRCNKNHKQMNAPTRTRCEPS
jgi:hypothetical protein